MNKPDDILACRELPSSRVLFREASVSVIEPWTLGAGSSPNSYMWLSQDL